jgi:hypothetical protein
MCNRLLVRPPWLPDRADLLQCLPKQRPSQGGAEERDSGAVGRGLPEAGGSGGSPDARRDRCLNPGWRAETRVMALGLSQWEDQEPWPP